MATNDRNIFKRPDGTWVNKRQGNDHATSVHDTQKEAYEAAKRNITNQGGGDVSIHRGDNGQIRDKNTIPPKSDPRHIKG